MKKQVQKSIRKKIHFETHLEPNLDQFWEPKTSQNGPGTGSKTKAILSRRQTRVQHDLTLVPGPPDPLLGGAFFAPGSMNQKRQRGPKAQKPKNPRTIDPKLPNDPKKKRPQESSDTPRAQGPANFKKEHLFFTSFLRIRGAQSRVKIVPRTMLS